LIGWIKQPENKGGTMPNLAPYRKLIVAAIGLGLMVGKQFFNLNVDDKNADTIVEAVISLLTMLGVYATSNAPKV